MIEDDRDWPGDVPLSTLDGLLDDMGRALARSLEERRRRRLRAKGAAVGLAAAALVAGLLLGPPRRGEQPLSEASGLGLDVESPRPFVVFETRDPDMTVIWQLEGE